MQRMPRRFGRKAKKWLENLSNRYYTEREEERQNESGEGEKHDDETDGTRWHLHTPSTTVL